MRDWFWQIREIGQGPDFVFSATFDESDAERLARVVRQHMPPTFVHNTDFIDADRRGRSARYTSYLDQHTHARQVELRDSATQASIWYYGEIEVGDHQLIVNIVLLGSGYGETALIAAVAQSPDVTLQTWQVAYSGYAWGEVARGTSAASLLEYLQFDG